MNLCSLHPDRTKQLVYGQCAEMVQSEQMGQDEPLNPGHAGAELVGEEGPAGGGVAEAMTEDDGGCSLDGGGHGCSTSITDRIWFLEESGSDEERRVDGSEEECAEQQCAECKDAEGAPSETTAGECNGGGSSRSALNK